MDNAKSFLGIVSKHRYEKGKQIYSNKVTVTGLVKNHYYIYQYRLDKEWVIENPPRLYYCRDDDENMKVLVVGDPQLGGNGDKVAYIPEAGGWQMQGEDNAARNDGFNWHYALKNAFSSHSNISFIISAGDQIHNNDHNRQEKQYASFLSAPHLRNYALVPTVGNHDNQHDDKEPTVNNFNHHFNIPNPMKDEINGAISGPGYYFTRGKALFIILNVNNETIKDHRNLIETAVSANPQKIWRIVVMHFDLYGPGMHINDKNTKALRAGLTPIFFENKIDIVIQGHDHIHSRTHLLTKTDKCYYGSDEEITRDNKKIPDVANYKCVNAYIPIYDDKKYGNENFVATEVKKAKGETIFDSDFRTVYNKPNGIVFFEASTSTGSIYHVPQILDISFNSRYGQPFTPLYSIMNISIDRKNKMTSLSFDTYKVSNNKRYDNGYIINKSYEDEYCWSEIQGYSCCPDNTPVYSTEDGSYWGIANNEWCGIRPESLNKCWSLIKGEKCCENPNTKVSLTDNDGKWVNENGHCWSKSQGFECCPDNTPIYPTKDGSYWGIVNNKWCGIIS
ncbi:hypothetical protein PIROE2DRAFT_62960 [Piromyces sp. E2]|nr:hypothetical protein PIROE2DRAFT_62960 [Piromyces sp. E2]|eukprot:OUM60748.1 hypothetical protein PIROE2DRAFT_62960 [Piromyces sp. E2]